MSGGLSNTNDILNYPLTVRAIGFFMSFFNFIQVFHFSSVILNDFRILIIFLFFYFNTYTILTWNKTRYVESKVLKFWCIRKSLYLFVAIKHWMKDNNRWGAVCYVRRSLWGLNNVSSQMLVLQGGQEILCCLFFYCNVYSTIINRFGYSPSLLQGR
jgi:hypothetical protein